MMNRFFVSGFLVLLFCQLKAQTEKKITLQQAIQTAIDNNIQVKQNELLAQIAEVNWKQSKSNILPNLNGIITHGINQGRSIDPYTNAYVDQKINTANYGLSSNVILFNGLSLQNSIRLNALSFEASKSELQQA
jgi:outer membrane protein